MKLPNIEKVYVLIEGGRVVRSRLSAFAGAVEVSGAENVSMALHKHAEYDDAKKAFSVRDVSAEKGAAKAARDAAAVAAIKSAGLVPGNASAADAMAARDKWRVALGL